MSQCDFRGISIESRTSDGQNVKPTAYVHWGKFRVCSGGCPEEWVQAPPPQDHLCIYFLPKRLENGLEGACAFAVSLDPSVFILYKPVRLRELPELHGRKKSKMLLPYYVS